MASTYKTLAQSSPAAATDTDAYTVPGATSAVVSSVVVCNTNSAGATMRLWVAVAGASTATKQYLVYDLTLAANETRTFTLGISLAATDVLRVRASTTNVAFNVFGVEIT